MLTFRAATLDDVAVLLRMESELFALPYGQGDLEYFIQEKHANVVVLERDTEIIGFFIVLLLFEEAQIAQLAVRSNYQNQGYGKMLLQEIIELAKNAGCEKLTLEVRVSNKKAIELYQKQGFGKLAFRKDYYQKPQEDGLVLRRGLL